MKRILIIEREYGCGAGIVAERAAQRLGWRLLDRARWNPRRRRVTRSMWTPGCIFLCAPRSLKVNLVEKHLRNRAEAEHLVDSVDQEHAAFIKHYFGKDWPNRQLYHLMVNTIIGLDRTVKLLLQTMAAIDQDEQTRVDLG